VVKAGAHCTVHGTLILGQGAKSWGVIHPSSPPVAHRASKRYRIESKRYRFHSHGAAKMGCIPQCDTPKLSLCSAHCATCIRSAKLAKTHHALLYRAYHTMRHIHVLLSTAPSPPLLSVANKMLKIIWFMLKRREPYQSRNERRYQQELNSVAP
jgi:hypothetical protein